MVLDGNAPGHVAGFITNCFNITAGVDQGAGNTRMFFQRCRRRVVGRVAGPGVGMAARVCEVGSSLERRRGMDRRDDAAGRHVDADRPTIRNA